MRVVDGFGFEFAPWLPLLSRAAQGELFNVSNLQLHHLSSQFINNLLELVRDAWHVVGIQQKVIIIINLMFWLELPQESS